MPVPPFYSQEIEGGVPSLVVRPHHGQSKALLSAKRIVAVIAGGRSGKTVCGPVFLHQEMLRLGREGAGNYLVAAPTCPLLEKGPGPEIDAYFGTTLGYGRMTAKPMRFTFNDFGCLSLWGHVPVKRPKIYFAHASDPDTIEAIGVKAAWLDECGQVGFRLGSWEAVQQRLSLDRGRLLLTSKPYCLHWMKKLVFDPWQEARAAGRDHPEIDVINYGSADNPAMPPEEVERARRTLPGWKFRMHWLGMFERPAGRIYDCFDEAAHVCDDFYIPGNWQRFGGLDFGNVNTAAVILARHPRTGIYYVTREYGPHGGLAAAGHAELLTKLVQKGHDYTRGEPDPHVKLWCGGSGSEDKWRREFTAAGAPVMPPAVADVEVGISRVYELLASNRLLVFRSCAGLLDDLASYSRVVDDAGEPTEAIEDKASWHRLDALRYIGTRLVHGSRAKGFAPYVAEGKGHGR